MVRIFLFCLGPVLCLGGTGCALSPRPAPEPVQTPLFVPGNSLETVWERTIGVLHDYRFRIARENKLDGIIETEYKVGSGVLEPWHPESVGLGNRLESTLQSIRRRVIVSITPTPEQDGFLVDVKAYKEEEDLIGQAATSQGGATFQEATPLQRDLNLVVGQSTPSGWIPLGRDVALEREMLCRLQTVLTP